MVSFFRSRQIPTTEPHRLARQLSGVCGIALLITAGCAHSPQTAPGPAEVPRDELIIKAMDPIRPVPNRVKWARQLDASGRQLLETELVSDLPELWGLEWRGRLAILEVVGGAKAHAALEELAAAGDVPQSARARQAINATLQRIEARLESSADRSREFIP